ncbi:MAG: hypothetical protein ACXVBG_17035 [Isosphaeraceae bacterium]
MAAKQRLAASDERYLRDKADIIIAEDYAAAYAAGPQPPSAGAMPGKP